MMGMAIIATILLALAINWWIVRPLFASYAEAQSGYSEELSGLLDQKKRCLQVLSDLELDLATQKISEKDYQVMKQQVSQELGSILQKIDSTS